MSIQYHFDLYPRDDPRDGARVVRFTKLQSAEFRLEQNGTGAGQISIRADDAEAQLIDPRGLQYVRVVEDNESVERVVGGFWLENGDFDALTERQTRLLTFGGPGTLAYLGRAVLWSRAYAYVADNIIDDNGTWHFYNQASITGGDYLGGVAFRVITEALSHAGSAVEVDEKTDSAIGDVQLGGSLGATNDSAGNDWTVPSGEFKAQVGDSVLSVIKRLMEAGLYIEMNPDTFELNVWERGAVNSRGDDKTGSAWAVVDSGTSKRIVRFQSPTDATVATGNIKSDAKRGIGAFLRASTVLAGDQGTFVAESDAGVDIPWHRYYPSDTQNTDTLSYIADAQLTVRGDAADTLRLRMKLGSDPANGRYYPFEWEPYAESGLDGVVMVNDLVTVHTGTGQWDYNEDTFPVAALTISLRPGGDWDCWVDLGSTYTSMAERAFQARGVATHSHPPNPYLCDPFVDGSTASCSLDVSAMTQIPTPNGDWETGTNDNWAWSALGAAGVQGPGSGGWEGSYYGTVNGAGHIRYTGLTSTGAAPYTFVAGTTYVFRIRTSNAAANTYFRISDTGLATIYAEASVNGGATWIETCLEFTPVSDMTNLVPLVSADALDDFHVDDIRVYTGGIGTNVLNGTSNRSAHCDHGHRYHSTAEPTVTDDTTRGFEVGDAWAQLDSLASPTAIVAEWILADATEGAAVWLLRDAGGVTDHGALTGLADDDHNYVRDRGGGEELVHAHGATGATETIDPEQGNWHALTLDTDCTLTLTNPAASVGCSLLVEVTQDGTGGHALTLPASVANKTELEAAQDTTASTTSFLILWTRNTGTDWYGAWVGGSSSVVALDDLSDVTITTPANTETLRYDGTGWVNDDRIWRPVMDGSGNVVVDGGTGEAIMALS